jgi:hypothetical protein
LLNFVWLKHCLVKRLNALSVNTLGKLNSEDISVALDVKDISGIIRNEL